jgi:hypothetical protein
MQGRFTEPLFVIQRSARLVAFPPYKLTADEPESMQKLKKKKI